MYRNTAGGGQSHSHRDLHTKFREDRSRDSIDMLADRETYRQTHSQLIAMLRTGFIGAE